MISRRSSFEIRISAPFIALAVASALTLSACSGDKAAAVVAPVTTEAAPTRPNIIFLLADDQRWDAVGYAGNTIVQTPNIDALAHDGVAFRNAYVTTPVCAISRASIFTGEYARRHGILDFTTDFTPDQLQQTYPALLHAAGYRTGFIGKFGVGDNPPGQAFDYWRGFAGQGEYLTQDSAGHSIHLTRLMSQQAIRFLDSQPRTQPFALSVSFKAPHVQDEAVNQFIPETNDAAMFSSVIVPPPATADDTYWEKFPAFFRVNNLARERWKALFSTPEKYQASVKGYYQLIKGLDRVVGEIRNELRRLNLDKNTVIVFSSDNGFFLGELGMAHKWYGQEPSVRVPLVVYDPRNLTGQGGRVESAVALNIDIAPTLLAVAGVPIPSQMEGRSLLPLVHGQAIPWRTDFLFEHLYPDPMIRRSAGVIGGRYKYLRYLDPNPNYEVLYDLGIDPNETTNFAQDPSYAAILAQLRVRYTQLLSQAK
jgi:arylsulfatase A-like enzyme